VRGAGHGYGTRPLSGHFSGSCKVIILPVRVDLNNQFAGESFWKKWLDPTASFR
jgi:hypothetical protein